MKTFGTEHRADQLSHPAGRAHRAAHRFPVREHADALDELCNRVQPVHRHAGGHRPGKIAGAQSLNLSGHAWTSRTGTSASVFNFEETHDTPLADILKEKLGLKIFIENDTKAMACGGIHVQGEQTVMKTSSMSTSAGVSGWALRHRRRESLLRQGRLFGRVRPRPHVQ
ncbi:MAG: hypothetical protein ACLUYV_05295 [Alistipes shahii]